AMKSPEVWEDPILWLALGTVAPSLALDIGMWLFPSQGDSGVMVHPHSFSRMTIPKKGNKKLSLAQRRAKDTEAILNEARKACFPAGTLVSTSSGLKSVEDLTTADQVWAFDHKSLVWRLRPVLQTFTHDYEGPLVTLEAGNE